MEQPLYDVTIVGAGPAGCATALALSARGRYRICLIDGGTPAGVRVGETLLPDTRALLEQLGIWQAFLADEHERCLGSCSAWGSATLGFNDFLLNPHGCGWHLERRRFDAFLQARADAAPGVQRIEARFEQAQAAADCGWELALTAGDERTRIIRSRYVVDATGHRAAFARKAGARPRLADRLLFVYGFFDTTEARSRSRLTVLEASEEGWWYAAHLPRQRLAVAYATDPALVRRNALTNENSWYATLLGTSHVAARLDGCRFVRGSVCVRAASAGRLDVVSGDRWLAVGDAGSVYDPLAAQGIHKALADGIGAARELARALEQGAPISADFGHAHALQYGEYLDNRDHFYGLEQRWPDAPFWRSRHGARQLGRTAP